MNILNYHMYVVQ